MPIDTSIYNALMQPRSVEDYAAQYDRQDMRKQAMQQNALMLQAGQQKQADYTRGLQDEDAIRNALSGLGAGATDDQRINALRGTGLPAGYTRADALQKTLTERDKGAADAAKSRAEAASKNGALFKQYAGILLQSPTQQTAQSLLAHYEQESGQPADNIRAIIQQAGENPEALRKIGAALSMEADKLLPKTEIRNLGGTDQAITTDIFGATTPGQSFAKTATPGEKLQANTAGARLAEDKRQFGITQAAAAEQRTFDRAKPTGGEWKPTEGQAKANLFGSRAEAADKILSELATKGTERPGVIKGVAEAAGNILGLGTESMGGALSDAAGAATNWTQSAAQQQVDQAQRDFINAILRRESGAVIGAGEFRSAAQQYFPQPGDSDAVKKQKADNRRLAVRGILAEVPKSGRDAMAPEGAAAPQRNITVDW